MNAVVAGVIQDKGKILVAQRDDGLLAGKWEFPGGKVEGAESPEEALVREIVEEFGVVI
jgi:mutator protein MutT